MWDQSLEPASLVGRLRNFFVFIALSGMGIAAVLGGWRYAVGFALGAAASWWSLHGTVQVVQKLGTPVSWGKPGAFAWTLFRFIVLVLGAFVILKCTSISFHAALAGLLVSIGAVILEAIYEFTYAR
jgi:hypothetical protein